MPDPSSWISIGLQTGGAVAVVSLFIWYLTRKNTEDDEARKVFLAHLAEKDRQSLAAVGQQMEYLQNRDAQSKEIAMSGHAALREQTLAIHELREEIRSSIRITATGTEFPSRPQ